MSKNIDEVLDRLFPHEIPVKMENGAWVPNFMTREEAKQAILADLLSVMPKKIEHQSYCDLLRTEFYINIEDINCSCSAQDINDTIDQVTAAIKNYIKGE